MNLDNFRTSDALARRVVRNTHIDFLLSSKDYHLAKAILPDIETLHIAMFPEFQRIIEVYGFEVKKMIVSSEVMHRIKSFTIYKYVVIDAATTSPCTLFGIETYVSGDIESNKIFFLNSSASVHSSSQTLMDIYQYIGTGSWENRSTIRGWEKAMNIREFCSYSVVAGR